MANIKINQKSYQVPHLEFGHMTKMEDMGFSVVEMLEKNHVFSLSTAFVGIVAECDRATAEELCQQHILGGGSLGEISTAFTEAVGESHFFQKLLNGNKEEETEEEKETTSSKKK